MKKSKLKKEFKLAYKIFRSKDKEYGNAWIESGYLFDALFPNGVNLNTPDDFARYNLVISIVGKMNRYAKNFNKGGHLDSGIDAAVYSLMLVHIDNKRNKK